MTAIGFIGLGNMGAPMAANLVKAGHQVTGYDIVPAAVATSGGERRPGSGERGRGRRCGRNRHYDAAGRAAGARGLSRQWRGAGTRAQGCAC